MFLVLFINIISDYNKDVNGNEVKTNGKKINLGGVFLTTRTDAQRNAAKAARNAYAKEWRRKNPDKVKAANARYWEKKAAEMKLAEEVATSNSEN